MDNIANDQEHISSKPQAVPHKINKPERETGKMPVLFVGHGMLGSGSRHMERAETYFP